MPDFRFAMMPHPLATLGEDEIDARVTGLVEKVVALLQQGQPA